MPKRQTALLKTEFETVPFYQPNALARILNMSLKYLACQGGWLAVRSGDYIVIKSHSNLPEIQEQRLVITGNVLLEKAVQDRKTQVLNKKDVLWKFIPRLGMASSTKSWIALPLVVGKRCIGLIAIWGNKQFLPGELENLGMFSTRIAPSVEGNITFADLSNRLHRMALLNDFAVTVFSSQDMEQIVQRTFGLLRRSFNTDRINLKVMSSGGTEAQSYIYHKGAIKESLSKNGVPSQVAKGNVFRIEKITPKLGYKPVYSGSRSALVVPLKFRQHVMGSLCLESEKEEYFTVNDEHVLAVIACYLSGLLENGRLRQEAEVRAQNLELIHAVVGRVIGQTDVRQVAQVAADLVARNFNYDLAMVALIRGPKKELWVAGMGGKSGAQIQKDLESMASVSKNNVARRVAKTGKSMLVNELKKDSMYLSFPHWKAGSEMCVALKEGDQSFGVIDVGSRQNNAFSKNDLLVLESLGGILASVISNVGQYQKLQMTVKQLRSTQDELQEHITAQRMAERRLVQAAKLAAVGEMAAGIAHELNNPLTTVSGFTELTLEEVPPGSRIHTDLELVLREAHRATDVVRRLLDFARQSESVRMRSDINEIIKEVLVLVNHLLHTNGVQLDTNLPNALPVISVDRNQVKQVILNLIHNALHAMPNGGELRITTSRNSRDHQDWVKVAITDSGTGISPENLERIFEPFFTTRAKEGGTGLGLSISYGIIADHGGFIEAESHVGKGSTFSTWIPVEVN